MLWIRIINKNTIFFENKNLALKLPGPCPAFLILAWICRHRSNTVISVGVLNVTFLCRFSIIRFSATKAITKRPRADAGISNVRKQFQGYVGVLTWF